MLNRIKRQVSQMLVTLRAAARQLASLDGAGRKVLLGDIARFVEAINAAAKPGQGAAALFRALEEYAAGNEAPLENALDEYVGAVEAVPVQYKVVFLPYYESTWDSLESIWAAFSADPAFVAEIIIMPVVRHDGKQMKLAYNDFLTPQGIPHTHYSQYSFEADKPDIAFINQPYDGVNLPRFASANIRPHVGFLAYAPYFMYMHQSIPDKDFADKLQVFSELPGHSAADLFIASGSTFLNVFKERSKNGHKMVALGSPKADYLHKRVNDFPRHPGWEARISGKTTFLLNTHYTSWLGDPHNNNPVAWFSHLINYVSAQDEDIALIWRPHPNTFVLVDSLPAPIQDLIRQIRAGLSPRIILDETGNAITALMYSDAVLSEYSSIITTAVCMDKPVFAINLDPIAHRRDTQEYFKPEYGDVIAKTQEPAPGKLTIHAALPCSGAKRHLRPGENAEEAMYRQPMMEFIRAIKAGEDPKAGLRRQYLHEHLVNLGGKCGAAVLEYVKQNHL